MKTLWEMEWKRKFSVNFYKNLKLKLAEMSFFKDFLHDRRGDPYPSLMHGEEKLSGGHYFAKNSERYFCSFFPYATYDMKLHALDGACGFGIHAKLGDVKILLLQENGALSVLFNGEKHETAYRFASGMRFLVTARKNNFEIYFDYGDMPEFIMELTAEHLAGIHAEKEFKNTFTSLLCEGEAELSNVSSYMDSGLSQADIRPVKYENGDIILENGKMYFTLTLRMHTEMYQGVFSWVPGTMEFELTGAIFFDDGDGFWESDVATTLKFNRKTGKWLLWVCSFARDHVLGFCESEGDFRFGVNVADITLMKKAEESDPLTRLVGFWGDEDPDIIYDEERGVWVFVCCRLLSQENKRGYGYYLFEGDSPDRPDRFIASSSSGEETGGSLLKLDGKLYLICGNSFKLRSNYRIYTLPDMQSCNTMKFDHDDGGFRGWGTIVPVKMGSRTRFFHLTFDRHNASDFNWSYGNLYCFEAE